MKTLKDAKIGDTVKVVKLHGEGPCLLYTSDAADDANWV